MNYFYDNHIFLNDFNEWRNCCFKLVNKNNA